MGYFPSPYPVVHIARRYSGVDPDTGNELLVEEAPVVRFAQEIVQQNSSDDLSAEFQDRVATELQMAVDDPTIYMTDDQVLVSPQINTDGSWVVGSGEAYWVDGVPDDQREGPWPELFRQFGGTVALKRVT